MPINPAEMTYEQARDELVGVVARLEAGGETLEGSLALWERGEALAARCQEWLDGARHRLDAARSAAPDGTATGTSGAPATGSTAATGSRGTTTVTTRATTTRTSPTAPTDPEDDR